MSVVVAAPHPIELVWTGPEINTSTVRDTVMVMQDLLAGARHDVLIAGYTFDHGREILLPLHQAMQHHGIKATLIINVSPLRSAPLPGVPP